MQAVSPIKQHASCLSTETACQLPLHLSSMPAVSPLKQHASCLSTMYARYTKLPLKPMSVQKLWPLYNSYLWMYAAETKNEMVEIYHYSR